LQFAAVGTRMSIDFVGDCLKCRGLSAPPVFQLLPPPTPPNLYILDNDDHHVDTSAPFVDLNVLFKCKLHNPIKTLTHHIVTTTHGHDMDPTSIGGSSGGDGQPFLNLNNFLVFVIIAFVFAILLVVVILFIVNFYR
jgi:hypothetical protein